MAPATWSELRRVWAVVIAVGVVLRAILLVELARPRDFLTGTNNAGSDGAIVHVDPGQRLCLHGLEVPEGTGRLQLVVDPPPRRPSPRRWLTVAARSSVGSSPWRRRAGSACQPGALDVPTRGARGGMTALCVSPSAPIDLAGRRGLETGQVAPRLDGQTDRCQGRGVVPPAAPASARACSPRCPTCSTAPRSSARASSVRGPTRVVLFVLSPALFAAALLLFVRAVLDRPVRRTALAVGVIGFLAAASWSLIVPVFDAPDEVEHVAYGQAIAERGRAPDAGPSRRRAYSSEVQVAYEGARISGYYGQRLGRPPWRPRATSAAGRAARRASGRGRTTGAAGSRPRITRRCTTRRSRRPTSPPAGSRSGRASRRCD